MGITNLDFSSEADGALPAPWTNWGTTAKGINIASGRVVGVGNPSAAGLARFSMYASAVGNAVPGSGTWAWVKVGQLASGGWFGVCAGTDASAASASGYMAMYNSVTGRVVIRKMSADLPAPTITTIGSSAPWTPASSDRLGITISVSIIPDLIIVTAWLDTGSGFVAVAAASDTGVVDRSGAGVGVYNYTAGTSGHPFNVGTGVAGTDMSFGDGVTLDATSEVNTTGVAAVALGGTVAVTGLASPYLVLPTTVGLSDSGRSTALPLGANRTAVALSDTNAASVSVT